MCQGSRCYRPDRRIVSRPRSHSDLAPLLPNTISTPRRGRACSLRRGGRWIRCGFPSGQIGRQWLRRLRRTCSEPRTGPASASGLRHGPETGGVSAEYRSRANPLLFALGVGLDRDTGTHQVSVAVGGVDSAHSRPEFLVTDPSQRIRRFFTSVRTCPLIGCDDGRRVR